MINVEQSEYRLLTDEEVSAVSGAYSYEFALWLGAYYYEPALQADFVGIVDYYPSPYWYILDYSDDGGNWAVYYDDNPYGEKRLAIGYIYS